MSVTEEKREKIYNFFGNNQILTECFIQLFEYQLSTVNDVKLVFRDGLIGFARDGERLRLYVIKDKNGVFRIKIKTATSHVFIPAEMINYQGDLDKNNLYYAKNNATIKSSEKGKTDVLQKPEKSVSLNRKANSKGVQRFLIKNISVDDIDTIRNCLNEFKRDGVKKIRVRITEIK